VLIHLSLQSSSQVDHLSSLPNELLDDIFEYAHLDSSPSEPLSKRLLPFFEKYLYRQVTLTSSVAVTRFVNSIIRRPYLGSFNTSLKIVELSVDQQLQQLLPFLSNLQNLDAPLCPSLCADTTQLALSPTFATRLRTISTSFALDVEGGVNLDDLAQYKWLPALRELKIYDWDEHEEDDVHCLEKTVLPNITALKVEGFAADMYSIESFFQVCPALVDLELYCTYAEGPDLNAQLPQLPLTLRSLHLFGLHPCRQPVDSILPSYIHLRSLRLGDGCYSQTIHTVLLQLPVLARIHLGKGEIDPSGFLSLLAGPSRLNSLTTIILDFDEGRMGTRIARPSKTDLVVAAEADDLDLNLDDWSLPGEDDDDGFDPEGVKGVIKAAKQSGITIKGSVFGALETLDCWGIELHNRSILYAVRSRDLTYVTRARSIAIKLGISLPSLDLGSLDVTRLEIVESNLPGQEWYVLSLKNWE